MSERAMRPFWIHQLAEYLIGIALVAQGLQSPEPLVPALAGAAVIVSAAITRGPLSAFRFIGRRVHRWVDLVLILLIVAAAIQPWVGADAGGRLVMLIILIPYGCLWFYTDWADKQSRKERRAAGAGAKSDDIGRSAGRIAGNAVKAIKKRSQ